jgi:ubiquitin conjugation factor E4 B
MRDPVMLPTSRKIVDRPTIKSHLLSDSKDPFNRMALSIEEVVPGLLDCLCEVQLLITSVAVPELKDRIDAFVVERRQQRMITDDQA